MPEIITQRKLNGFWQPGTKPPHAGWLVEPGCNPDKSSGWIVCESCWQLGTQKASVIQVEDTKSLKSLLGGSCEPAAGYVCAECAHHQHYPERFKHQWCVLGHHKPITYNNRNRPVVSLTPGPGATNAAPSSLPASSVAPPPGIESQNLAITDGQTQTAQNPLGPTESSVAPQATADPADEFDIKEVLKLIETTIDITLVKKVDTLAGHINQLETSMQALQQSIRELHDKVDKAITQADEEERRRTRSLGSSSSRMSTDEDWVKEGKAGGKEKR